MPAFALEGTIVRLVTFTLTHPDFPEITWNISQIEQDAFRGRFGDVEEIQFSQLAQYSDESDKWRHIDREKVLKFIRLANVPVTRPNWQRSDGEARQMRLIDIPTIAVVLLTGPTTGAAFPIDGNHRMIAREQLGYKSYTRFIVPPELEGEYRIQLQEF
jgi:hypothetical protein